MGGREDVFWVSSWEVGTRSSSSASGRKREKGGEGEERGRRGEERGGEGRRGEERGGEERRGEERRGEGMRMKRRQEVVTLHTHLTGPLAFWSEFA